MPDERYTLEAYRRDAERYRKLKTLHVSGRRPTWFELYFEPDLDAFVDEKLPYDRSAPDWMDCPECDGKGYTMPGNFVCGNCGDFGRVRRPTPPTEESA